MLLAILPLVLYALHLAVSGDFLLLALILISAGVWVLPKLFAGKATGSPATEVNSATGIFDQDNQVFVLPSAQITGDITLLGPSEACNRFLNQLFIDSVEEIWCLGDLGVNCYKSFALDSPQDIAELLTRSKISLPFTVIAHSDSWQQHSVSSWPKERSFRVVIIGSLAYSTESNLVVSFTGEGIRASGNLGERAVDLILRDVLLPSEPADNLGNDRVLTGGSLDLVSQTSREHRPASSNESKWLNFPAGRLVIDKTKLGFGTLPAKNQVGQSLASEMRSSDAISDIAARLRKLGHGV